MAKKSKYTLVGVDGNAYAVMAYVANAMKREGFTRAEIDEYRKKAMSSDYNNFICVSLEYVELANNR